MSSFGKTSGGRLSTCHEDLQTVFNEAIKDTPVDFSIVCGVRGREDQEEAKRDGRSKASFGQSPHNYRPSFALDIVPMVNGVARWDDVAAFRRCADHIMDVAETMGIDLTWGGDWNHDGDETVTDAWDKPHFQLQDWKALAKVAELAE
jgi:peptidoglycan L-alanyl-D-glutamate endopeptidase CwlK